MKSDAKRFILAWNTVHRIGGFQADVAEVLGITPAAVRQRAFQLRKKGTKLKLLNGMKLSRELLRVAKQDVKDAIEEGNV